MNQFFFFPLKDEKMFLSSIRQKKVDGGRKHQVTVFTLMKYFLLAYFFVWTKITSQCKKS